MIQSVPYLKAPYFKGKNFLSQLCPIAKFGIPKEADSIRDKRVIGTPQWETFWDEELYKILNGVQCGGMWIPGMFYYYMNYTWMQHPERGVIRPDYVDLHLELAYLIDYAKANGKNIIAPKGRRRGISEFTHKAVIDYGWRFKEAYKGGVAGGKKIYVDDFLAKWRFGDSKMPPELSVKKLLDNDDEIIAGYQIKDEFGAFVERGTRNMIYARTMHTNPNMFKGLFLNDAVAEEVGEFEKFLEFYSATKDALMSGKKQVGTMFCYGTGGNINKGSKDFKKAWEEASHFGFIKFLIPATRFYFYGGATLEQNKLPKDSWLYNEYKEYQLPGVEDIRAAEADINERRASFLKSGNLKEYNEDLQNNPINEKEIFKKTVINNFDVNKLNEQDFRISSAEYKKYSKYRFDWDKDDNGMIKIPYKVIQRALKPHEDDSKCVWIIDTEHPKKNFSNLYVAGIDSYDQDTSKTSKSLGAMCVMIRENAINNAMKKVPVAVIRCRPPRKEEFYEVCLQLSIYYNLVGNVLIDVRNPGIIQYFKDRNCSKYLAQRPAKFESPNSEQGHDFGVSLNSYSKPMMVSLMQTNIYDYSQNNWFPDLINELGNYDEIEIGSDNDLADAYGIALMQDVNADLKPKDQTNDDNDDTFDLPEFYKDANGDLRMGGDMPDLKDIEQDHDRFGQGY